GKWVTNGTTFYLQNVSGGLPLTAVNTLAAVTVSVNNGPVTSSITANPNPITVTDGTPTGVTTLSWTSANTTAVEIHVSAPNGPLFAIGASGTGSATTGKWVIDGTAFYLQNVSGGLPLTYVNTLAAVTVHVRSGPPAGSIAASPNPIVVTDGTGVGATTVSWSSSGVSLEDHET